MPSYQSQSLNFLRRQVRQVREGVARKFRQGSLLAVWTLQIALYPIYLVFQSSRLVGRQLQASAQKTAPKLKAIGQAIQRTVNPNRPPRLPLTTDAPVKNLLRSLPSDLPALVDTDLEGAYLDLPPAFDELHAALEFALPPDGETTVGDASVAAARLLQSSRSSALIQDVPSTLNIATDGPTRIQGVASLLGDRHLVLVAANNGILDILSHEQQQRLQERIVLEIARYYQHQRQLHPPVRPFSRRLPLPKVTERQWLPVQWFRRAMAWMQTSDVAIATNVFQEALALPASPFADAPLVDVQRISPWEWDRAAASSRALVRSLEPLSPVSSPKPSPSFSTPSVSYPTLTRLPGGGLRALWTQLTTWLSPSTAVVPPDRCELELLSWNSRPAIAPSQWPTSWVGTGPVNSEPIYSLAQPLNTAMSRQNRGDRALSTLSTTSGLLTVDALQTKQTDAVDQGLQPLSSSETAVEAKPEWVDTSAIVVGYAKHPLEIILSWVDSGLVWVEQQLAQVWRWLTNHN